MSFPDMSQEHGDWEEPATFTVITKSVVDHEVSEAQAAAVTFQGIFYQQRPKEVNFKPEGQRQWSWWHLQTTQALTLDDIIEKSGIKYRVWHKTDRTAAGYYEYEVAQSYEAVS